MLIDSNGRGVPTRARYILWKNNVPCYGYYRNNICIFSTGDLSSLIERNEFFANKLLIEYDPIAYECMEEWLNKRIATHFNVNMINYCRLAVVRKYADSHHCKT